MHYALQGKYPIETKEQIKTAVDYFDKFLGRFDPADRAFIALNIEKRASDLSYDVDRDWIINYSRMFHKHAQVSPDFERNIEARKTICNQRNISVDINGTQIKLAKAFDDLLERKDRLHGAMLVKAVEFLDKTAHLTLEYDNKIVDPIMTVYGSLNNSKYDAVKIAGSVTNYTLQKATKQTEVMEKIAEKMGSDFANKFKQNPEDSISKLGSPEKAVLIEVLS